MFGYPFDDYYVSGGVLRCHVLDGQPVPLSVEHARHRLRWCIRHDREACGDGRWVLTFAVPVRVIWAFLAAPDPQWPTWLFKPRYRWEPRR